MSRPRRKNTSRACEECRLRRTKCNGETPSCGRCSARGIDCVYSSKEDERRPAPRSYVRMLRKRIADLESVLYANSIDVNDTVPSLGAKIADSPILSPSSTEQPAPALQSQVNGQRGVTNRFSSTLSGALSTDEAMNFVQDGEPRYFGATSGRLEFRRTNPLATPSKAAHSLKACDQFKGLCQDLLDEHVISPDLEDHLLDLYFTWDQPFFQVVDEGLFKHSRETGGRYYSPLLLNSMLCLASRHSDRCDVRSDRKDPNTAGRLFLEKADVLLYYELKWPSITTIQSLLILTTAYCAFGEDAACWLHHGMAARLALDMGLNFEPGSLPDAYQLSPEEIFLRRQVYWAIYCCDKLSAAYTGRVCTFLDSQAAVELPSDSLQLSNGLRSGRLPPRYANMGSLFRALTSVNQIIEKILLSIYAPKPCICSDQRKGFFLSCILSLKNWHYDLPDGLRLDASGTQPASLYTIHMIYHTAYILLSKPFSLLGQGLKGQKNQEAGNGSTDEDCIMQEAREISYKAASNICQVAKKYRKVFGSFRRSPITATHCTLSAILVLLNAKSARWEDLNRVENNRNIELCLLVLEELGTSWLPARKIGHNVEKLYHHIKERKIDNASPPRRTSGHDQRQIELRPLDSSSSTAQYSGAQGIVLQQCNGDARDGRTRPFQESSSNHEASALNLSEQHNYYDFIDALGTEWIPASFFGENDVQFSSNVFPSDYSSFDMLSRSHFQGMW